MSCAQPEHDIKPLQAAQLQKHVNDSRTLLLAVSTQDAEQMLRNHKLTGSKKREVTLGSAAPVSADGWFLTANHVVADAAGHELVVIYDVSGHRRYGKATVVWRDAKADLALLKSPVPTPEFYHFSPRNEDLPAGTQILHAGITTGNKAQIGELAERVSGKGSAGFMHTLRLAPGDSGGPVLLFSGELVGVNCAVGLVTTLDTTFFSASRSARPDPRLLAKIMSGQARQP